MIRAVFALAVAMGAAAWPTSASAAERTAANPLTPGEIDLVGPFVEYMQAIPLKPGAGKSGAEHHVVGVLNERKPQTDNSLFLNTTLNSMSDVSKLISDRMLVYDGLEKGFYMNPDTAKRQRIMDFEWPQSRTQPSYSEKWKAMAALVKAITDQHPAITVYVDSFRGDKGTTLWDPFVWVRNWGSRSGNSLKVSLRTDGGMRNFSEVNLNYDVDSMKLKGGTVVEERPSQAFVYRKRARIGRNEREKVVSIEVENNSDKMHLKIDRTGVYEATGYWDELVPGDNRPEWKLVSARDPNDKTWASVSRIEQEIKRFESKVEVARVERANIEKNERLERARKLKDNPAAVPNPQILKLMEEILTRSPPETELSLSGEVLHEGYGAPVTEYFGYHGGSGVRILGVDGDDFVDLLQRKKKTGQDSAPWRSIEEVRLHLAKLTQATGEHANVRFSLGQPIFGETSLYGHVSNGKIVVAGPIEIDGSPGVTSKLLDQVVFDEELKVVGGKVRVERTQGNLRVETTYRRTGGIADKIRETRFTLHEKGPYQGTALSPMVKTGVLKVSPKAIHIATEMRPSGEVLSWGTLLERKKGSIRATNDERMELLEKFKAGKLPRPRMVKHKMRGGKR